MDWLKQWNLYSKNRPALTFGETNQTFSYGQLFELSKKAAYWLQHKHQIKAGDNIVHLSTNEPASIVLFFALSRLGATLVPVNFRLTSRELSYVISNAEPKLVVFEETFKGALIEAEKEIEQQTGLTRKSWLPLVGTGSFWEQIQTEKNQFEDFLSTDDTTGLIIYTSGTTGFPKGACITHKTLFWNSLNTTMRLNIVETDAAVIFLPLFHTGGWNVLTTPFFHRGAHIILTKKFDADQILQLSSDHKATLVFGVPTTMAMLSQSKLFATADLSHVRYAIVGGEPMPLEQIKTWENRGIPIRQGYGLTEFGPNVFSLGEQDSKRKMGSIGFPNFYVEVKVILEDGSTGKANDIGELWLKGPMAMKGYWKNPTATDETFSDGWLKTGDLVYFDDEGYFYVVGRKKDMYKSGGENVYPAEIEQVIQQLPWVQEAAVVGVKDPQWGEVGHAFVSCNTTAFSEEQLREHLQKNLAKFKIPKFITRLDQLPKGDSGKILKRKLLEMV